MTPRAREMLQAYHEEMPRWRIALRRDGEADCQARAKVVDFDEAEIVGGIQEGKRKLLVLASGVTWSDPLREGDLAIVDGAELYVNTVDDQRRRVDGTLIAYEVTAGGR
ncbi:hypothetical protein [Aureimonas sp. AU12]|uniref:hypothetical protein n=1 Tax=Aureimonas sp. AU12 TaxID=1638161 RepID=UPI0007843015|nr:hypothetical protein [Aureimonas sp. AU12]